MTKKILALALVAVVAVVAVVAGGCYHGKQVESLTTPNQPDGAQAIITTTRGVVSGELLSVEDIGLVLLSGTRVVLVPFTSVRSGRFPEFARAVSLGAGKPDPQNADRIRLVSHFPGGISPEIKAKLLAMYRQTDWASLP